jgi:hypothetical protein
MLPAELFLHSLDRARPPSRRVYLDEGTAQFHVSFGHVKAVWHAG